VGFISILYFYTCLLLVFILLYLVLYTVCLSNSLHPLPPHTPHTQVLRYGPDTGHKNHGDIHPHLDGTQTAAVAILSLGNDANFVVCHPGMYPIIEYPNIVCVDIWPPKYATYPPTYPIPHTNTPTHPHTHTPTHPHSHTPTHPHHPHHPHTHPLSIKPTPSMVQPSIKPTHTYTHPHPHTNTYIHIHTQTHTHAPSPDRCHKFFRQSPGGDKKITPTYYILHLCIKTHNLYMTLTY
jgi:hypothetical protein